MITISGTIGRNDKEVPAGLFLLRNTERNRVGLQFTKKSLFAYLFTNRTKTVNGTHYLVNQGTSNMSSKVISDEPFVAEFSAKGDTLLDINSQASLFDWNFSDNVGQLEVGYIGIDTFLTTGDSTPLITANGTNIIKGT